VDQLHAADIGSVFEWLSNRQSQVSLTEYEGMKSWLIDYAPFNRQIVRVWILPDRGFSVVKIECTSSSANGQHHAQTTTVSTYKQFQTIWFPEVVEFSYTLNGELHNHERITVREAVFNLPISVDAFNISAMNLAKGRPVLAPGNVGMEWDGSKLVSQVAEQPRINVAAETTTSTWLLVCYAAIATSVAALIFVRYARARAT
jgi:hypothetical protein